jgi:D-alanine--poly(phosphoribitol) ligase subunit 2
MQETIKGFIMELLKKKSRLPNGFNNATDFIHSGIVDSIGIIKFVLELESRFAIEISDIDIESDEFRSVQGLVSMIERKVAAGIP